MDALWALLLAALLGPAPGGEPALRCGSVEAPRGGPMVYVPAGHFWRGSTPEEEPYRETTRPRKRVWVDAFWIDRAEVSVRDYAACVHAGVCTPPDTASTHCVERPESLFLEPWLHAETLGDHPVACVTRPQAEVYCRWVGKCLPSEDAWEKAARGADGRPYPWGWYEPSSQDARFGHFADPPALEDPAPGQRFVFTAPVGQRPRGASPYGALDMSGNVWEWTRGLEGGEAPLRGGRYLGPEAAPAPAFARALAAPDAARSDIGFRCAW